MEHPYRKFYLLPLYALCLLLPLPAVGAAGTRPPAGSVSLENSTVSGRHCATGADAARLEDGQVYLQASLRGVAETKFSMKKARAMCAWVVHLKIPPGWQAGLAKVEGRVQKNLDPAVKGVAEASGWYGAGGPRGRVKMQWQGPAAGNAPLGGALDKTVWSPCGGGKPLRIQASVRVNNRKAAGASGTIEMDALKAGLVWRPCQGKP